MGQSNSRLIKRWKKFTLRMVKRRFGDTVDLRIVDKFLDGLIEKELKVPLGYWVNNFREKVIPTDALAAIETIERADFIVGGAGTVYLQHNSIPNPLLGYILTQKNKRSAEKKTRDTFERGLDAAWDRFNTKQNNTKVIMNSLYGVLGYAKFIFHNIFLAEAITRMGRVIIATAACGFENFLADNIKFSTTSEMYEYVNYIIEEYEENYKDKYDFSMLGVRVTVEDVLERIERKCSFPLEMATKHHLLAIIANAPHDAQLMLFYKNNFFAFNRIPIIKQKIMTIVSGIDELKVPDLKKITDPHIRDEMDDLWTFYNTFVFYNKPIYDNVRKMAYGTREAVLYIDTDSNFITLSRWVEQIRHEFFEDKYNKDPKEMVFICSNIITIFLSIVVDRNLQMLAANCNITPEWAKFLAMKNEFFFWRLLFGDVKKRYVGLQLLQEGKLLKDGMGLPEIKGYDFRKSVTKKYIRDFYTQLCMDEIMRPDEINLQKILAQLFDLKKEIRRSMEAGESMYFKQANVNPAEHYADPLRIPGIKGVMLWNVLCPDYPIDLPSDVDLVPIKNLSAKKNREWLMTAWPDVYAKIDREFFNNRNPNIAAMTINVIAKPKNPNIPIPPWFADIMDTDKIVNSSIKLINPIMDSLGCKIQRPSAQKEYLTNIVDL